MPLVLTSGQPVLYGGYTTYRCDLTKVSRHYKVKGVRLGMETESHALFYSADETCKSALTSHVDEISGSFQKESGCMVARIRNRNDAYSWPTGRPCFPTPAAAAHGTLEANLRRRGACGFSFELKGPRTAARAWVGSRTIAKGRGMSAGSRAREVDIRTCQAAGNIHKKHQCANRTCAGREIVQRKHPAPSSGRLALESECGGAGRIIKILDATGHATVNLEA
ncbi:hypothetical protein B0H11DRAFT_1909400 [Mycena galericulata]|nr:hypothetical protein B0H11DRAFT_1909400 [Mycena galericulata]